MDEAFAIKVARHDVGLLGTVQARRAIVMSRAENGFVIVSTNEAEVFDAWVKALEHAGRPFAVVRRPA